MPVCTPKGPPGFQDHGTRGRSDDSGLSMPSDGRGVTSGGAGGDDVGGYRRFFRMGRSGLVMGTLGGASSPVTLGLSRCRYDSPSTTRS